MIDLKWHLRSCSVKAAIWLLKLSGWYHGYWNYWRITFAFAENRGIHIIPCHYYSPIPNTGELPEELWQRNRLPIGFDLRIEPAMQWLTKLSQRYRGELSTFRVERALAGHTYYLNNTAFKAGDAEVLYLILRQLKPRRIIEIGSGYSTLLICQAIRANHEEMPEYHCEFIAIEPNPPSFLTPLPPELTRLEPKPIQEITSDLFSSLSENDVLFIDSSHAVRIGSDCVHECLTILPALAPGVVVHIHDIFIPAEYPRMFIDEARFFWNEQYLLEAFLSFNHEFEVIMPVHAIWSLHREAFSEAIPSIKGERMAPCSFWVRRVKPGNPLTWISSPDMDV
jgi:predicted O-methyltransferase YrrM